MQEKHIEEDICGKLEGNFLKNPLNFDVMLKFQRY
jgi:hypothetical protein